MKISSSFMRTLCAAFAFATLLGAFIGGNAYASATSRTWQIVPSANGTEAFNQLSGVAAISKDNAWAVGRSRGFSSFQSLIEHWNGKTWQTVSTPDAGLFPDLKAVATIPGTKQVWAVGTQFDANNGQQPLIERWDGKAWQLVPSPIIPGQPEVPTNILHSVVALSKDDAWATGVYNKGSQLQAELIEHWDGKQWSIVPSASIPDSNNAWLYGVTACSANDVWAVGTTIGSIGDTALTEHWNGQSWQLVQTPTVTTSLKGVACVPHSNQVWAVGEAGAIERWDGTNWQVTASPNAATLTGVTALSATNAWVVGAQNSQGLIEHWDGTNWSVVSQPVPSTPNELAAITSIPRSGDLWAVGDTTIDANSQLTLIERYS